MHGSTTRVICFINTKKYEWINILEYYQGNKNKGIIFPVNMSQLIWKK